MSEYLVESSANVNAIVGTPSPGSGYHAEC
jgi:hypothetical protein